jgi:two-component system, OmpR family, copper resistance phosphate regulon response regulator CusR
MRMLIAEDDPALASFVKKGLEAEHYAVDVSSDGEWVRAQASEFNYDLLVLDLNLPRLDGVSILRHLRTRKPSMPILILTGRSRIEDRVQCLDLGADDYLVKPFSFTELSARIRALLRRSHLPAESVLQVEDLKLDRVERKAERAGRRIELTSKEFALLEYLMRNVRRQFFVSLTRPSSDLTIPIKTECSETENALTRRGLSAVLWSLRRTNCLRIPCRRGAQDGSLRLFAGDLLHVYCLAAGASLNGLAFNPRHLGFWIGLVPADVDLVAELYGNMVGHSPSRQRSVTTPQGRMGFLSLNLNDLSGVILVGCRNAEPKRLHHRLFQPGQARGREGRQLGPDRPGQGLEHVASLLQPAAAGLRQDVARRRNREGEVNQPINQQKDGIEKTTTNIHAQTGPKMKMTA